MKYIKKIIFSCLMISLGYISIQAAMDNNQNSYTLRRFNPADQYNGPGMIGNYCASNHIATINGPNFNEHLFIEVNEGGITPPEGKVLIGSYFYSPPASKNGIKRMGIRQINLYGIEQNLG